MPGKSNLRGAPANPFGKQIDAAEVGPDVATQAELDAGTHVQGTDQGLDTGGANAVTAAQTKTAYTHSQVAHAPSGAEANPAAASQAEAEAGTEVALRSFSPERVAQAIAALGGGGGGGETVYNAGNSGATITINWTNGYTQKVTLTANCHISFSNPGADLTHTLILIQDATGGWRATFQDDVRFSTGPIDRRLQPVEQAEVKLRYRSGMYAAETFDDKVANPSSLPPSHCHEVFVHPNGDFVFLGHDTTPFISAYEWTGANFGAKIANPSSLPPGYGKGVAVHPNGDFVFIAVDTSPFILAYEWTGTGFGAKVADPASLPPDVGTRVFVHPNGNFVFLSHSTSPYISAYEWTGAGFGAKIANPSSLPAGYGYGIAVHPNGDFVFVAHGTTPFISAYEWTGTGFGAKVADPASLPTTSGVYAVFIHPNGDIVFIGHDTSPFISAYEWTGSGFGSKIANPSSLPASTVKGLFVHPSEDFVFVAHRNSPFVAAYNSPALAKNYLETGFAR